MNITAGRTRGLGSYEYEYLHMCITRRACMLRGREQRDAAHARVLALLATTLA